MRILIVEDETSLREGLADLIRASGHEVSTAATAKNGLEQALAQPHDLVVLDLMLPDGDGVDVCRELRSKVPATAILMLTARGSEDDKVVGLEAGADDYVTKPFGARELLARIDAIARRTSAASEVPDQIEIDDCLIDMGRHTAQRSNTVVTLTPREVAILRWLYRHRQRAVSRGELLEQVWESRGDLKTRTVDMTIANLRQKIETDPTHPRIVTSIVGYY